MKKDYLTLKSFKYFIFLKQYFQSGLTAYSHSENILQTQIIGYDCQHVVIQAKVAILYFWIFTNYIFIIRIL